VGKQASTRAKKGKGGLVVRGEFPWKDRWTGHSKSRWRPRKEEGIFAGGRGQCLKKGKTRRLGLGERRVKGPGKRDFLVKFRKGEDAPTGGAGKKGKN